MRVVVAGAHGQVARRLGGLLSAREDTVVGIVRDPDHRPPLPARLLHGRGPGGRRRLAGRGRRGVHGLRPRKLAAEQDLLARPALTVTVLRPGGLTDDPGTGRVTLAERVDRGSIPRDDVAAVLVALLDARPTVAVLELVSGRTPVADAVAALR